MSKTVLVTGASRGIGKSIAQTLAELGYRVFICARNEAALKETAQKINAAGYYACDVTNFEECQKLINNIGDVDILVNNAGAYIWNPVEKTSEAELNLLTDLNIKAPFRLISLCTPAMKQKKWGRIINIGSISGVVGEANASLYSMTKSAFNGLSKALGLELAEYNITVNTINPGWVKTELADDAINTSDFSENEVLDMIPQRRFIRPAEIAQLVKYLASDDARGITAQNISLCAGLSAG